MLLVEEGLSSQQTPRERREKTLPYSSSVEGRLRREVRGGVADHHRAAPGQAGGGGGGGGSSAATASAGPAAAAEVEVVQEALAAADGVRPLLRWWREREEKGRQMGPVPKLSLPIHSTSRRDRARGLSQSQLPDPTSPSWQGPAHLCT